MRFRPAAVALSVAVLGVTGCGGSDVPPPAAAPAPPAPVASGSTTPVSAGGSGGIGTDIESEQKAAKRSLRAWGKAANRVCRKSEKRLKPWEERFDASKDDGGKVTKAGAMRAGRMVARFGRVAEREYDALTAIAMPKEADAVHAIDSFLQKQEEAMIIVHRLGADFSAANDRDSALNGIRRLNRITKDHARAARAVNAPACDETW